MIASYLFSWLLKYPDWIAIGFVAILVSLVNALIYKYIGNAEKMKEIKGKMKSLMEEYRKKKSKKTLKEVDKLQSEYMSLSLKPMLFSLLFVFLVFPWLAQAYGTKEGTNFILMGKNITVSYDGTYHIRGDLNLDTGKLFQIDGKTFKLSGTEKFKVSRVVIELPFSLPLIGKEIGWILYYIIIAIPSSMLARKALGVDV